MGKLEARHLEIGEIVLIEYEPFFNVDWTINRIYTGFVRKIYPNGKITTSNRIINTKEYADSTTFLELGIKNLGRVQKPSQRALHGPNNYKIGDLVANIIGDTDPKNNKTVVGFITHKYDDRVIISNYWPHAGRPLFKRISYDLSYSNDMIVIESAERIKEFYKSRDNPFNKI